MFRHGVDPVCALWALLAGWRKGALRVTGFRIPGGFNHARYVMKAAAIVLHGPTSAGKSSLASALQDSAPVPAFHVALDAFVTMSRRRDMRTPDEWRQAYRIHCENLRSTLARLADTRFEVIVDFVLRDEAELRATLRVLENRPVCLVGVRAPLDILEARERQRADRTIGMAREQSEHPAFGRDYDLVIDTSRHSPLDGAVAIRDFLRDHPRKPRPTI
jgi:chloramphenicol 3-O phosphotransferase